MNCEELLGVLRAESHRTVTLEKGQESNLHPWPGTLAATKRDCPVITGNSKVVYAAFAILSSTATALFTSFTPKNTTGESVESRPL